MPPRMIMPQTNQQRQSRERQETLPRRNNPNLSQRNHLASRQPQSTLQGPPRHSGYNLQNTPARQNYYQGNYTDALEQSIMAMNNSLVEILQEQQSAQLETTHALANLSRSHEDQAIDHIIKDIPKFNGNWDKFFTWLLKFETLVELANADPRRVVLHKVEGSVLKCVKQFGPTAPWNNIKNELRRQFSHLPTPIHANV